MSTRQWRITGLIAILGILFLALASGQHIRSRTSSWLQHTQATETESTKTHVVESHATETQAAETQIAQTTSRCDAWPDAGNLAIAVKTGATEAIRRIPTLMLTFLECAETVMIFSDLEQDIAGYHLHDALASIDKSVMEDNSDFDFYAKLRQADQLGQVEELLGDFHDPRTESDLAAWTLDKYKQLHILEELYQAHPDKDWYIMIDADTYLVWANLLQWLAQLPDPRTNAQYLGAPAQIGDVQFGHGGSGVILSHAAMAKFNEQNAAQHWDKRMHDECCGDYIIGRVLLQSNIKLKASWPTINGETPFTIPYGEGHWCQPVVSMHHVSPAEMNKMHYFERARNNTKPLTFSELFDRFIRNVLPISLDDWNNRSDGDIIEAESFEDCEAACIAQKECFQYMYSEQECRRGHHARIGRAARPENGRSWRSGWLRDKILDWTDRQAACHTKFPWT